MVESLEVPVAANCCEDEAAPASEIQSRRKPFRYGSGPQNPGRGRIQALLMTLPTRSMNQTFELRVPSDPLRPPQPFPAPEPAPGREPAPDGPEEPDVPLPGPDPIEPSQI